MLTVKISEHWNTEPLKDVVGIEETSKNLSKVANNIVPMYLLSSERKKKKKNFRIVIIKINKQLNH